MSQILDDLVEHLTLTKIDDNLYVGESRDPGWGRVFGGQVLGQALAAAGQTVAASRKVHSLHGYFLLPGDVSYPIVFEVERVRDGGTFSTRRVQGIQKGRPIFTLLASFHESQESFQHQDRMPKCPDPEELKPTWEHARERGDAFPDGLRQYFMTEGPIDQRPVTYRNPFEPTVKDPTSMRWVRANGGLPDNERLHRELLAYASDFSFLDVSMHPHGESWVNPQLQVASLDHAMYFHRPFRFDEWLLFVVRSPNLSGARGLVLGEVFSREGDLVATAVQEGLVRFLE